MVGFNCRELYLDDTSFVRKALVTGKTKTHLTLDDIHSVSTKLLAKDWQDGPIKVGDFVLYRGEDLKRMGEKVWEIIRKTSRDEKLRIGEFAPEEDFNGVPNQTDQRTVVPEPRPSPTHETLQEEKDDESDENRRFIGGFISERRGNLLILNKDRNNEHFIDLAELRRKVSFDPIEGDYVRVEVRVKEFLDEEPQLDYTAVLPDEYQPEKSGIVTSMLDRRCLIDDKVVLLSREFSVGDLVRYQAISSTQMYGGKDFEWRAINVQLKSASAFEKSTQREDLCRGVEISPEDLEVQFDEIGDKKTETFTITNNSSTSQILRKVLRPGRKNELQSRLVEEFQNRTVLPGESFLCKVEIKASFVGTYSEQFTFLFDKFRVKASVTVTVLDHQGKYPSVGTGPYYKNTNYTRKVFNKNEAFPGERPNPISRFVDRKVGSYPVEDSLRDMILQQVPKSHVFNQLRETYEILPETLSAENYAKKFHLLLHLEEIEKFHNMRIYDRERARFVPEEDFLALYIENVLELRPRLSIGDSVEAFKPILDTSYDGFIHRVMSDRILIKFQDAFHKAYQGEDYRLVFRASRRGFRCNHEAISRVIETLGPDFLFPESLTLKSAKERLEVKGGKLLLEGTPRAYPWFNESLNPIQKKAVCEVVKGVARPFPYVIFGPPGTGKTMTLVECVLQIKTILPDSKVLVAAPSNSAVNLILERLIESGNVQPTELARISSYNLIEQDGIPSHLRAFCCTVQTAREDTTVDDSTVMNGVKIKLPKEAFVKKRIVLGTCGVLGSLMEIDFKQEKFTHILVDEAGQLKEPEALVPAHAIDPKNGQIVLAGDPNQLGPIVMSKYASKFGLSTSYLDRVMDFPLYRKDPETGMFNPSLMTQLVYSYRSVPSLMKCYNEIFYAGQLKAMVEESDSEEAKFLEMLQPAISENSEYYKQAVVGAGIHFVPVRGKNVQEEFNPSWMNRLEAKILVRTLTNILKLKVASEDIGVITPYQLQCKHIREVMREAGIKQPVKVGTVEEFQGQERKVILISTVRSSESEMDYDRRFALGFLKEPRRLNVAISRAKSLVMIFGNKELLQRDSYWGRVISYCIKTGTFHGPQEDNREISNGLT